MVADYQITYLKESGAMTYHVCFVFATALWSMMVSGGCFGAHGSVQCWFAINNNRPSQNEIPCDIPMIDTTPLCKTKLEVQPHHFDDWSLIQMIDFHHVPAAQRFEGRARLFVWQRTPHMFLACSDFGCQNLPPLAHVGYQRVRRESATLVGDLPTRNGHFPLLYSLLEGSCEHPKTPLLIC